ncbi:hypothetical protein Ate02nite_54800 [Paractinoplanes tereljensis]|uniref:Uncharacterized protein n=1 Tax=Paractinoplanes tereljensis TaxID=571912 RepID=A0A919NPP6_9ACTN|nr:hypothetical protein Ate02nite_54800 [Actinoplanes tereljensis]
MSRRLVHTAALPPAPDSYFWEFDQVIVPEPGVKAMTATSLTSAARPVASELIHLAVFDCLFDWSRN